MTGTVVTSHHTAPISNEIGTGLHLEEVLHIGLNRLGGLKRWVSSGTLLSLHRDGQFKPTDNDIDVGVLNVGIDRNNIFDRMFPWAPYREVNHDGVLQQFAFVAERGILFDICFYYPQSDAGGDHLMHNTRNRRLVKPARLFSPLQVWDSPVGKIPAPNDLDAYCAMRYGDGWRTPSEGKGIYDDRY